MKAGKMHKRKGRVGGHHRRGQKSGLPPGTPVFVGERKQEKTHVHVLRYTHDSIEEFDDGADGRLTGPAAKGAVSWINIDGVHDVDVVARLARQFGLHPLTVEDIVNTGQRPKAEEFEHYLFIVMKMLSYDDGKKAVEIENVSLVLGENFVLSFQERSGGDPFDGLRERLRGGGGKIRAMDAGFLVYSLMDAVLDGYFVAMEKLGDHIEELDDEILDCPDQGHMARLHRIKREVLFLRKSIWPLREVISLLEKSESPLIGTHTRTFLRDLYDHCIQAIDVVETYRDIIGGMHDTFLSSLSNRMNEVMKVLTLIATVFIPLTFIAGVYGMNFDYMPELRWRYGYFIVMGFMALVAGVLLVWFRRRRWL